MPRKCQLSNKQKNNGYSISHSHKRTKKIQNVNLQYKRVWSQTKKCWIKIRISTKCLKSLHKISF
uniref:Large ribosomal subunit protein bL28c n=1 Tax=Gastroclonium compressum TaxID=1852973 RepID=A0A173FZY6_GASCM|nr:ribosomal protein L28 [Coeloseira compressa]ANH09594.1 ribosomal protein L28 [Coeloseira compressa]